MLRTTLLALIGVSLLCVLPARAHGQSVGLRAARQGPWIVYRYPLFRPSNRAPSERRYSQPYYWPADAREPYPKFYGGFHSRYFDTIGRPSGDIGLRGFAW